MPDQTDEHQWTLLDERRWIERFIGQLHAVAPDLNVADAEAHAREFYAELGDEDPVRAAEIYAEELRRPRPDLLN